MTIHGVRLKHVKDVALIAVFAAVLFAQQVAFAFIPNVQLTSLLLVLYSKLLGFRKTTLIITIHVIATNLLSPFGPVLPLHIPSMFIGWMLIPILLSTVFRRVEGVWGLSLFGFVFGFLYGWAFIPISVFAFGIPFIEYFIMDLPFEFVMAITNFLTILWLYEPLYKFLSNQLQRYYQ